jgi:hypothetical protein
MPSTSTGLAASTDRLGALLSGLEEVLERDALASTWLNALPGRRLELDEAAPLFALYWENASLNERRAPGFAAQLDADARRPARAPQLFFSGEELPLEAPGDPLARLQRNRKSARTYAARPLPLRELGSLCSAFAGLPDGRRVIPSAGAKYPLEVFLFGFSVEGHPGGLGSASPTRASPATSSAASARAHSSGASASSARTHSWPLAMQSEPPADREPGAPSLERHLPSGGGIRSGRQASEPEASPGGATQVPVRLVEPRAKAQVAFTDSPEHALTASCGGPRCPGGGPLGRHARLVPPGGVSQVPVRLLSPMVNEQAALAARLAHAVTASGGGPCPCPGPRPGSPATTGAAANSIETATLHGVLFMSYVLE